MSDYLQNPNPPSPEAENKRQKIISMYFPENETAPQPCPNINNLNDHCLTELFRRQFTLQEMMLLRRVCAQWKALIEQLFLGKLSLKIFFHTNTLQEHFRELRKMIESIGVENGQEKLFTLQSDDNGVDDVLVLQEIPLKKIPPYDGYDDVIGGSRAYKTAHRIKKTPAYSFKNSKQFLRTINNKNESNYNPVPYQWPYHKFLPNLFPNVENLFILYPKHYEQCHEELLTRSNLTLADLLKRWPRLRSFALKNLSIPKPDIYYQWVEKLAETLQNDLPLLTSLHLFSQKSFINQLPVEVLERLKRLTIVTEAKHSERHREIEVELLLHLKQCTRLISIGSNNLLCDECLNSEKKEKLLDDNTVLTHFTFVDDEKYFGNCGMFKALTRMDVTYVQDHQNMQPFQQLIKILEKLTNLNELQIKMTGFYTISDAQFSGLNSSFNHNNLPVLPRVKILHLRVLLSFILPAGVIQSRRLEPAFLHVLPRMFPNLQVAKLIAISPIVESELTMCFKSRGDNHFPRLRTVEFQSYDKMIDLAKYCGPHYDLLKPPPPTKSIKDV